MHFMMPVYVSKLGKVVVKCGRCKLTIEEINHEAKCKADEN